MKTTALILFLLLALSTTAAAALQTREVAYTAGGTVMKGYLAHDDAFEGRRPAILVVHEWWGHNAYARKRAKMLAELGYAALAVDMYGNGRTAAHPEDAGRFAGEIRSNMSLAGERFAAAVELVKVPFRFGREFGLPLAYDREADEKSWQQMRDFFREIFNME